MQIRIFGNWQLCRYCQDIRVKNIRIFWYFRSSIPILKLFKIFQLFYVFWSQKCHFQGSTLIEKSNFSGTSPLHLIKQSSFWSPSFCSVDLSLIFKGMDTMAYKCLNFPLIDAPPPQPINNCWTKYTQDNIIPVYQILAVTARSSFMTLKSSNPPVYSRRPFIFFALGAIHKGRPTDPGEEGRWKPDIYCYLLRNYIV